MFTVRSLGCLPHLSSVLQRWWSCLGDTVLALSFCNPRLLRSSFWLSLILIHHVLHMAVRSCVLSLSFDATYLLVESIIQSSWMIRTMICQDWTATFRISLRSSHENSLMSATFLPSLYHCLSEAWFYFMQCLTVCWYFGCKRNFSSYCLCSNRVWILDIV